MDRGGGLVSTVIVSKAKRQTREYPQTLSNLQKGRNLTKSSSRSGSLQSLKVFLVRVENAVITM